MASGSGTKDDPWVLPTAPGTSNYTMYKDEQANRPPSCAKSGRRR